MKTILFICKGNTCRSPMAAAIAQNYFRSQNKDICVISAGIRADNGHPITKEAGVSLTELNIPYHHESHFLTDLMLERSDYIFAMEKGQIEVVQQRINHLSLAHQPHITLLNEPEEIADPYGCSLATYRHLANFLSIIIPKRLENLI